MKLEEFLELYKLAVEYDYQSEMPLLLLLDYYQDDLKSSFENSMLHKHLRTIGLIDSPTIINSVLWYMLDSISYQGFWKTLEDVQYQNNLKVLLSYKKRLN